jgi:hypothetical protein
MLGLQSARETQKKAPRTGLNAKVILGGYQGVCARLIMRITLKRSDLIAARVLAAALIDIRAAGHLIQLSVSQFHQRIAFYSHSFLPAGYTPAWESYRK